MSHGSPADKDEYLRAILAQAGTAFQKLVNLGCDPTVLGRLLAFVRRTRTPLKSGRDIKFFVQDSHEAMLNGMSAGLARRKLKKASAAVEKLREAMLPFAGARIWRGLRLPEPDFKEICASFSASIQALEARLGEIGPQKMPAFEWRVRAIIEYVRKTTGGYHDEWLAELLGAASPPRYPKFETGDALRKWRSKRGIVDRP